MQLLKICRELRQQLANRRGLGTELRSLELPPLWQPPQDHGRKIDKVKVNLPDDVLAYYVLLGNGNMARGVHRHYGWPEPVGKPGTVAGHKRRVRPGARGRHVFMPRELLQRLKYREAYPISECLERAAEMGKPLEPPWSRPQGIDATPVRVLIHITPACAAYFQSLDPTATRIDRNIELHYYG